MGVATTLLGLAPLALGGTLAARRVFRLPPGLPALLAAVVLAWAWLTVGMIGLGTVGWLGRGPVLGWSLMGLAAGWLATRGRTLPDPPDPSPNGGGWSVEAAAAVGLMLWAAIVFLIPSLIFPVKVVSDGPIYHLYFAARWWQAGRIELVPTPFGESAAPYFPAVGDLWLTWLFILDGGDRLARVGQSPFLGIAAATMYATARRLGAGTSSSAIATAWFVTVMPLLIFSFEPNVDTIFVAGYLMAVYFAMRHLLGDDGPGSLVLSGLAAGGAWGTKATGIVFIPPLLALISLAVMTRPGPLRLRVGRALIVLTTPFLLEGYWPIRNAWLTGNPLYPLVISAFGRTVFPGWYGSGAMPTSPYYIDGADLASFIDILLLVFDPRLAPVWVLAVAGAWRVGKTRSPEVRAVWACAGLALANIVLFWAAIPYRTQQRFLLHGAGLAAVPLAMLFDRGRVVRWIAVALLAIHVLTPQVWPFPSPEGRPPWDLSDLIPNTTPAFVRFAPAIEAVRGRDPLAAEWGRGRLLVGCGCLAAGGMVGLAMKRQRLGSAVLGGWLVLLGVGEASLTAPARLEPWRFRFPDFRDYLAGWIELELRTGRGGVRIAYSGTNLPYYLMGPGFRNQVRYVNVDDHPDWLLHDYHRAAPALGLSASWPDTRPNWERARPDYEAWLENLRAGGIELLVVTRANPNEGRLNPYDREGFPIERAWADARPDRFILLHEDPSFRLYAVRPGPKMGSGPTDRPASPHY